MPDDKAQVILRDLVDRHGPFSGSADDRRRCRGLLLDLAGSHKLEINLLLRALESGAPERLAAGRTTLGLVTPRLVRELQETHGLSAENATWSVDAWMFALGLKTAAEQERQRIAAEQARQAAAVRAAEDKRRLEAAEQERQRIDAEQARLAAARAAEEKRRQEAAERERQRIASEQARRQQRTLFQQQIRSELVPIPAGEFLYGEDKKRIWLDAYAIAKTPVTNRQYKVFADVTGHRVPKHWQEGNIPAGKEDHPVVYVSWDDAVAFCQWAGVALPSEQQWEKAARGTDGRAYPWGDAAPDKSRCNFNNEMGDTTPAGTYLAGANGLFDMAGNVWEWCADWHTKDKYRVTRGGSWMGKHLSVHCAYRNGNYPFIRNEGDGFRVVSHYLAPVRRADEEEEKRKGAAPKAHIEAQERKYLLAMLGIVTVCIPTDTFLYGDDKRRIELEEFWISKAPVTNRQYKAFVDATGHRAPDHWLRGMIPTDKEDHPVVYVSWDDAVAFCQWAGVALPSEQQWEKAARGTDGRTYPWGEAEPDKSRCNFNNEVGDTTPVGKYPAGAYGLFDMAGNVWEWCADWYERKYRVVRGGSYYTTDKDWVHCAARRRGDPSYRSAGNGFRIVSPSS
jgi:formylglycine-generating enzyme required for sulfatase activity